VTLVAAGAAKGADGAAALGAAKAAVRAGDAPEVVLVDEKSDADPHRTASREEQGMRVAITASGPDLSSPVDMRFGRARYLLVVDTSDRKVTPIDNHAGMDATQGAGIQAAQAVVDNNVSVLITGHCGPKAFRALRAAGVHVYLTPETTVDDAIDLFQKGEIKHISAADVDSHW
jgi:predicted Fe-Mo cluster-binding NifX family protein